MGSPTGQPYGQSYLLLQPPCLGVCDVDIDAFIARAASVWVVFIKGDVYVDVDVVAALVRDTWTDCLRSFPVSIVWAR